MITVLRGDKSGDKEALLLRIPKDLLAKVGETVRGERAPGIIKLIELGLDAHLKSGKDITIDVPRPIKAKPQAKAKPSVLADLEAATAKPDAVSVLQAAASKSGFGRKAAK